MFRGNTVSSQLGPAGVKSVCCSLCFSDRVDSQGACREQGLGKSSCLPLLCLEGLEWNSKGPAEMSGGRKEGLQPRRNCGFESFPLGFFCLQ